MIISFDAAGTLITMKEPVASVYARYAKMHGINIQETNLLNAFKQAFQIPDPDYDVTRTGEEIEKDWWRSVVAESFKLATQGSITSEHESFENIFKQLYNHYASGDAWQLYSDTLPALQQLQKEGYKLCITSNFDARLLRVLNDLKISAYFENIITSASAKARKPNPAIFDVLCQTIDAAPNDILHVGDCPKRDLEAAQSYGMAAFLVNRPETDLQGVSSFCEEIVKKA